MNFTIADFNIAAAILDADDFKVQSLESSDFKTAEFDPIAISNADEVATGKTAAK